MENNARDGVETLDYEDIAVDFFSDATGYKDTVDTGSTTAPYDSVNKKYATTSFVEVGDTSSNSAFSANFLRLMPVPLTNGDTINTLEVNVQAAAGNFRLGLYDSSGNLLGETADTVVGGTGWQGASVTPINITSTATYYLGVVHNNASLNIYFNSSESQKFTAHTYGALPDPWGSPSDQSDTRLNVRAGISASSGVIQTNSLVTESSNINTVQVNIKSPSASTITVDVSSDGGSTFTTDINLNEKVALTSTLGTSLKLKFHLDSGEDISGYSVAWWI